MTEGERKAAKQAAPGNEAGIEESETTPISSEEVCSTTTAKRSFGLLFDKCHPKLFCVSDGLCIPRERDLVLNKAIEELIDKILQWPGVLA